MNHSAISVRYRSASIDGLNVFYREGGNPLSPTLLLLHGFPTSSHMFRDLIPLLADRFHVIAPDYIGFGQSDAPDHSSFTYSFDNVTVPSIGRFRGVHGATGKSVDAAYAHLWMVRDGQITRFRQFIDTLAIAQAGL